MKKYQGLFGAVVAVGMLASGAASATCMDEITRLQGKADSAGGGAASGGSATTKTAKDPNPPASAPAGSMEKQKASQDQGTGAGKSGSDPAASTSGKSEEGQKGMTTAAGEEMGGGGSRTSGDAKMLLADAQSRHAAGDEAGCMKAVEKVKQSMGGK